MHLRVDGPADSRTFALKDAGRSWVAGRDAKADIHLPDPSRLLSRQHLSFGMEADRIRVTMLSTTSGAYTSRGALQPGATMLLSGGDHVQLGPYRLTLVAEAEPVPTPAPVEAPSDTPARAVPASHRNNDDVDLSELLCLVMPHAGPSAATPPVSGEYWVTPEPGERAPIMAGDIGTPEPAAPSAGFGLGQAMQALGLRIDDQSSNAASPLQVIQNVLSGGAASGGSAALASSAQPVPQPLRVEVSSAPPTTESDDDESWRRLYSRVSASASESVAAETAAVDGPVLGGAPQPPIDVPASDAGTTAPPQPPAGIVAPPPPADWVAAFSAGLGLELPADTTPAQWTQFGTALRELTEGYARLLAARAEMKSTLLRDRRTEYWMHDNNPLKAPLGVAERLRTLLLGDGSDRYLPAPQAITEATVDLLSHNVAIIGASRSCIADLVKSFDPQRWKASVDPGVSSGLGRLSLVSQARLWRSLCASYAGKAEHLADWIEQLFDEHFVDAYVDESERVHRSHLPRR